MAVTIPNQQLLSPSYFSGANPYSLNNPYVQQQQAQQASSGGSSNGGFFNNISNIPTSPFTGGGGLISGIVDTAGAHLGFGSGASVVGAAGPLQPIASAGSLTSAPLSAVLGPAALGAGIGGIAAKITGGNSTGGTLGGTAGALIGAGAAFGPLGIIAGGILGGLGGSLFGKKKPSDKTMAGGVMLHTGEINSDYATKWSSTGNKYDENNATFRDTIQNATSGLSKWLLQNGATPKDPLDPDKALVLINGSRDGLRYYKAGVHGAEPELNFGDDYAAYSKSLAKDIISEYNIPAELQKQLDNLDYSDISNLKSADAAKQGNYQYQPPTVQRKSPDQQSFQQFYDKYKQGLSNATA